MNTIANNIFFDTLQQFTTDPAAGGAVRAAVHAALESAPELYDRAEKEAATNLRWFSAQGADRRVQIMALAEAVKKHEQQKRGRTRDGVEPARARLEYLQIATAIYRHLAKKKTAVNEVVKETAIQTSAAYRAIVRANLPLIKQLRGVKTTKNWQTISKILYQVIHTKIPSGTLSKIATEELTKAGAGAVVAPLVMTHYEKEEISTETRQAYEQAGYINIIEGKASS